MIFLPFPPSEEADGSFFPILSPHQIHLEKWFSDINQNRGFALTAPFVVEKKIEGRDRWNLDGDGLNSHFFEE